MRESAKGKAQEHGDDVVAGTFYGTMYACALIFGILGCVPGLQLAWLVTGLCFVLALIGRGAENDRATYNNPDVAERASGCGKWALLGVLAGAAFFALLLGGMFA